MILFSHWDFHSILNSVIFPLWNVLITGEAEHTFEGEAEKFHVFPKISNCTSGFWAVSFISGYRNSTALGKRSLGKLIPSFGLLYSFFFSCLLKNTCSKCNVVDSQQYFSSILQYFHKCLQSEKQKELLLSKDTLYQNIKACISLKKPKAAARN